MSDAENKEQLLKPDKLEAARFLSRSEGNTPVASPRRQRRATMTPLQPKDYFPSLVPTSFHWDEGGEDLKLIGSWTQWTVEHPMERHVTEDGETIFTTVIELPVGIHSYKFVVDGEWMYAQDQQVLHEQNGITNNCVSVTALTLEHPPSMPASLTVGGLDFIVDREKEDPACFPDRKHLFTNQFLLQGVGGVTRLEKEKAIDIEAPISAEKVPEVPKKINDDTSKLVLADRRLVIIMVGLPARGKSFVSNKVARYLRWLGYKTKVFNIGSYRRDRLGSFHSHDFFRADNPEGLAARQRMCELALDDLRQWMEGGGNVGILDGTNHTSARRKYLCEQLEAFEQTHNFTIKIMFIEILCNDPDIFKANLELKIEMSPDYKGVDPEKAALDFQLRIKHYEDAYETLTDKRYSFVKVFNVGEGTVTNRITGFIPTRIVFLLMNLHIQPRPIYFTRHGESEYNVENRIGGNAPLSANGRNYAAALAQFMEKPPEDFNHLAFDSEEDLCLWTSTMLRAVQTAEHVKHAQMVQWKALKEIDVGDCDGMTYEDFKAQRPHEYALRKADKLRYRYPGTGGESYMDLITRLEPVIVELERQPKPVLVIAHRAVLRCLLAYYKDLDIEEAPHLPVPLHTVIKLVPTGYKPVEVRYKLEVPTSYGVQSQDGLSEEP
eukprot:comp23526_c0_seq2/m.39546 comp23526_c0_seq2/g.39546  ORF comp23526_c0_seq2/g.39546 comp23526_c0_seq2/m.39546 type:complete len:664 (-) comp23526_c0_seq2:87-2078(-)